MTADEYAAWKAIYLKDARAVLAGRSTESDFSLNGYSPTQRRQLIELDLAEIAARAAAPEASADTSNTAKRAAPIKDERPINTREKSETVYQQYKREYLANSRK
jgi:hypothetical protein